MKYKAKVCPVCGKTFIPLSPNAIYCSAKCRRKSSTIYIPKKEKQLCWDCKRATGFCPWSKFGQKVDGWKAVLHKTKDRIETYNIRECPLFIKGRSMLYDD